MEDFNVNIKLLEALLKDGKVNRFKRFEYKIFGENYTEYDELGYGEDFDNIGEGFFYQDVDSTFRDREISNLVTIIAVIEGFYDKEGHEYITKVEKRG